MKNSINNNTDNSETLKRAIFVLAGITLLSINYFKPFSSASIAQDLGNMQIFQQNVGLGDYDNPKFYWWEKALCSGYKSSSFCPDGPLHPYVEAQRGDGEYIPKTKKPKRVTTVRYDNIIGAS